MLSAVQNLNTILGIATFLAQITLAGVVVLFFLRNCRISRTIIHTLQKNAVSLGFFLGAGVALLALIYSDVFGFVPCPLCWWQRVFFFPLPILLGISWWKKDAGVWKYVLALSIAGILVSIYHHLLQTGLGHALPCPATGDGDCGQRIIFELGYITFPLMAATAFAWMIFLSTIALKKHPTDHNEPKNI